MKGKKMMPIEQNKQMTSNKEAEETEKKKFPFKGNRKKQQAKDMKNLQDQVVIMTDMVEDNGCFIRSATNSLANDVINLAENTEENQKKTNRSINSLTDDLKDAVEILLATAEDTEKNRKDINDLKDNNKQKDELDKVQSKKIQDNYVVNREQDKAIGQNTENIKELQDSVAQKEELDKKQTDEIKTSKVFSIISIIISFCSIVLCVFMLLKIY